MSGGQKPLCSPVKLVRQHTGKIWNQHFWYYCFAKSKCLILSKSQFQYSRNLKDLTSKLLKGSSFFGIINCKTLATDLQCSHYSNVMQSRGPSISQSWEELPAVPGQSGRSHNFLRQSLTETSDTLRSLHNNYIQRDFLPDAFNRIRQPNACFCLPSQVFVWLST